MRENKVLSKTLREDVGDNVYAITKVKEDQVFFANAGVRKGLTFVSEEGFESTFNACIDKACIGRSPLRTQWKVMLRGVCASNRHLQQTVLHRLVP